MLLPVQHLLLPVAHGILRDEDGRALLVLAHHTIRSPHPAVDVLVDDLALDVRVVLGQDLRDEIAGKTRVVRSTDVVLLILKVDEVSVICGAIAHQEVKAVAEGMEDYGEVELLAIDPCRCGD